MTAPPPTSTPPAAVPLPGVLPFGDAAFLSAWRAYAGPSFRPVDALTDDPYLQRAFGLRHLGGVFPVLEAAGWGVSDCFDLDWSHTSPDALRQLIQRFAASRLACLHLPRLTGESRLDEELTSIAVEQGLHTWQLPYETAPYADLTGGPAPYEARKNGRSRKDLRRKLRRLQEHGEVAFQHFTTPADVATHLPTAFDLYRRRAETQYRGTLWHTPAGQQLLQAWAQHLARRGWMDLTILSVDTHPLAFCFGFHNTADYFHYGVAFDPAPTFARYSPGLLLTEHLVMRALEHGFRRYDFLLGGEGYKYLWATDERTVYTRLFARPSTISTLQTALLHTGLRLRQFLRQARLVRAGMQTMRTWKQRSG